jgi:hypothetical protein
MKKKYPPKENFLLRKDMQIPWRSTDFESELIILFLKPHTYSLLTNI